MRIELKYVICIVSHKFDVLSLVSWHFYVGWQNLLDECWYSHGMMMTRWQKQI